MVIVGDGTPDNYVLVILAHHLDGGKLVGTSKHAERRGLAVLEEFKTYLEASKQLTTAILLVDRDDRPLAALTEGIEAALKEAGVAVRDLVDGSRVKEVEVEVGGREIELVVLVNDVELEGARKGTVESHLLRAMGEIHGFERVRQLLRASEGDPKRAWRRVSEKEAEEVFERLVKDRDFARRIFPQHFEAFERLLERG